MADEKADASVRDLYDSVKDLSKGFIDKHRDRSAFKLIEKTIKSLKDTLDALDAFLKTKGVDVGKAADQAKDKAKSAYDKAKAFVTNKDIDLKTKITSAGVGLFDKVKELIPGKDKQDTGPPEDDEEDDDKKGEKKEKKDEKKSDDKPAKKEPGWIDKMKERLDKRKSEVDAEKKSVLDRMKGKTKDGWLGKILGGLASLGGFLIKGIGGIMGLASKGIIHSVKFLGGFLFKGFSKTLFNLVPALSGGIGKALQAGVGKLMSMMPGGLWAGAKAAVSGAGSLIAQAAPVVGRGALMLATGPVGWAVAAGTAAYAGYKLYKYLTRNDVSDDVYGRMTRLRLAMYGFNDMNKEYYSKIFDLEMLMRKYIEFKDYKVVVKKMDADAVEEVLDIFGVKREDKENYNILNVWFMKRFMPAYRAFVSALWSINNAIYLDELEKLNWGNLLTFVSRFSVPKDIYNVTQVPVKGNPTVYVTQKDVDMLLINISIEAKSNAPKDDGMEKVVKKNTEAAKTPPKQVDTPPPVTKSEAAPVPAAQPGLTSKSIDTGKEAPPSSDQEGEPKPVGIKTDEPPKSDAKPPSKLNAATGAMQPGGMSLEGITTKKDKQAIYNLDPNVRELFTGMAKEYNNLTGKNIPVNEAFRSFDEQAAMYKKNPGKAAKPGNSTHEFGLALDVNPETVRELDKLGLLRKYGFTTSVGGEPWHLEPIGVSINPSRAKTDPNFRQAMVTSSPGKGGGGYGLDPKSIMKKRDLGFQQAIFKSGGDNPIDVAKMAEKQTDIPLKPSGTGSDGSKTVTEGGSPGNMNTTATASKLAVPPSSDQEGEKKPSGGIPKTTTPVTGPAEQTPTLNTVTPAAPGIGGNMDIGKYANLGPEEAIRQAAKMTGMDENTLLTFAKMESSLKATAKAGTSRASGLFQIVPDTWKELVAKHGPKYGIPADADRNNPFYNAVMAAEYAKSNLKSLGDFSKAGIEESTALYLAHHFGAGGARKIIAQLSGGKTDTPMGSVLSPEAMKANAAELTGHTVSTYLEKLGTKMAKAASTDSSKYTGKPKTVTDAAGPMTLATAPPPSTPQPSMTSKAIPAATSIGGSKVDVAKSVSAPRPVEKEGQATQPYKEMFSSSKMESILGDQLNVLNQIAGILSSINDKFDPAGVAGKATETVKSAIPQMEKMIPNSSISLSRKKISA